MTSIVLVEKGQARMLRVAIELLRVFTPAIRAAKFLVGGRTSESKILHSRSFVKCPQ